MPSNPLQDTIAQSIKGGIWSENLWVVAITIKEP